MTNNEDGDSHDRILGLKAVLRATHYTLEDDNARALFGLPVDTTTLPDYLDIIEHPKDLGTILSEVENSLEGNGPYTSAEDALADVRLVWENCLRYNTRPEDKVIISICKQSRRRFNKGLKKSCGELQATISGITESTKLVAPRFIPSHQSGRYFECFK